MFISDRNIFFRRFLHQGAFFLVLVLLTLFLSAPLLLEAQTKGIVPCEGPRASSGGAPCTYNTLLLGVQNLLNFLIYFAGVVAVVMFVWAGFLLITAAGSSGKVTQAHSIFKNTAIGFIFVIGAWLIVSTILGFLAEDPESLPLEDIEATQF
ncbi:hypothetical protein COV42_00240 [Candidatus Campbellbacteria bacterium CG11_big_fil_rev_8_21_14_0_20_44_21]|uniref:Uncharacterized protein n=1 Tax=Candidatus Campbellbacteria bacterium CG22_combo_CG10-13_8_21_14_all_43_18 TaxID=1974530 RepID=A0A2H0DX94_9BACT|nr:MAG: hypothetical protein COW82_01150 [Candidatus Campbellbacteria bacterium CG22_combo_CG10-13_8_21_14_all_43_18]PIR24506.1 MAG: hypothetical protein COV42_00240 [Candidatus Campbellbacteria bacterium CG11_big_fil_rev_8_21_14_0_20_44_21]